MTRIAFCDDDAALLHQMQDFLEQYRTLRGVQLELAPYTKPMELLADIEAGVRFDVLFLDVLMPGINGINAAREIRQYDTAVQIIFVTSSSEFAVQSYVVGAYYYQLKPIWKDSFFRLTDAVLAECRKRTQHSLILRCKSGVTRITLDSLEYCEVQGRTLVFHLLDGQQTLGSGRLHRRAAGTAGHLLLWRQSHGCPVPLPPHHPPAAVCRAGAVQRTKGLAAGGGAHGLPVLSGAALGGAGRGAVLPAASAGAAGG